MSDKPEVFLEGGIDEIFPPLAFFSHFDCPCLTKIVGVKKNGNGYDVKLSKQGQSLSSFEEIPYELGLHLLRQYASVLRGLSESYITATCSKFGVSGGDLVIWDVYDVTLAYTNEDVLIRPLLLLLYEILFEYVDYELDDLYDKRSLNRFLKLLDENVRDTDYTEYYGFLKSCLETESISEVLNELLKQGKTEDFLYERIEFVEKLPVDGGSNVNQATFPGDVSKELIFHKDRFTILEKSSILFSLVMSYTQDILSQSQLSLIATCCVFVVETLRDMEPPSLEELINLGPMRKYQKHAQTYLSLVLQSQGFNVFVES